jgi:thiol-disulfide isomerase/thioredoxin
MGSELLPEEEPPPGTASQFPKTDFGRHSVPYAEIGSVLPRDRIPAIDAPSYVSIDEADEWLGSQEPVILVEIEGQARAYPLQILTWHEIVNDTLAGVPIAVTFCPLCNTAIGFERRVDDQILTFGTTGRLRFSNLVMYDRQTESWWQQATGEAIVGEHTGRVLRAIPASIIGWESYQASYPDGDVLSRDTGHNRPYGQNPYPGYDDVNQPPFLYDGPPTPGELLPMARVATIDLDGEAVAYPYDVLEQVRVVNDTVGETPVVVFWKPGTASALDSSVIAEGRDVGAVNTFSRELEGRSLTFRLDGERVVDDQTGSIWNMFGEAIDGPLQGSELNPVVHINHFWFSWAAFRPETRVYSTEDTTQATPEEEVDTLEEVQVPSDFQVDLYQGSGALGSNTVYFSDAFAPGRPVVLVMWAGLCPTCRFELPAMQATYLAYKDQITFLGVDIGPYTGLGTPGDGVALLNELGVTFPAGSTPDAAIMQAYRVLGVPETLIFTSEGELVDRWTGIRSEAYLAEQLDALLAGREASS